MANIFIMLTLNLLETKVISLYQQYYLEPDQCAHPGSLTKLYTVGWSFSYSQNW